MNNFASRKGQMDTRTLKIFKAVVDAGTVSKAANKVTVYLIILINSKPSP